MQQPGVNPARALEFFYALACDGSSTCCISGYSAAETRFRLLSNLDMLLAAASLAADYDLHYQGSCGSAPKFHDCQTYCLGLLTSLFTLQGIAWSSIPADVLCSAASLALQRLNFGDLTTVVYARAVVAVLENASANFPGRVVLVGGPLAEPSSSSSGAAAATFFASSKVAPLRLEEALASLQRQLDEPGPCEDALRGLALVCTALDAAQSQECVALLLRALAAHRLSQRVCCLALYSLAAVLSSGGRDCCASAALAASAVAAIDEALKAYGQGRQYAPALCRNACAALCALTATPAGVQAFHAAAALLPSLVRLLRGNATAVLPHASEICERGCHVLANCASAGASHLGRLVEAEAIPLLALVYSAHRREPLVCGHIMSAALQLGAAAPEAWERAGKGAALLLQDARASVSSVPV